MVRLNAQQLRTSDPLPLVKKNLKKNKRMKKVIIAIQRVMRVFAGQLIFQQKLILKK